MTQKLPWNQTYEHLFTLYSNKSMSSQPVCFFQTPGPIGQTAFKNGFSQAVSIPASARIVITSPQLGCSIHTGELIRTSPTDQINAAFECVDAALRSAGVNEGIRATHKMVAYLADLKYEALVMSLWRERCPDIKPTWASVAVSELLFEGQIVAIQAEATIL